MLATMERTADRGPGCPEGWPIVDVRTVNHDPHRMDDCWHRGAYRVYTLRGTRICEEQLPSDGIGDTFTRLMTRIRQAGYVGYVEFIGTGAPYRVLHSTESY